MNIDSNLRYNLLGYLNYSEELEIVPKGVGIISDDLVSFYTDGLNGRWINDHWEMRMILEEYQDNIITLMGISKSYSLAALRSGLVFGNKYIIDDMRDNIFVQMDSISYLSQIALASIFNNSKQRIRYKKEFLNIINKKYQFNLDIVKYFVEGQKSISEESRKKIEIVIYKKGILR